MFHRKLTSLLSQKTLGLRSSLSLRQRSYGSPSHSQVNEPGGYLFGQPAGAKREWYWWEPIYYVGFYGGTLVFLLAEFYSPKKGPADYAALEAHKRLAERGETFGWPLPPDFALVDVEKK